MLCSGKTLAEMKPLAGRLGLACPLIVENGGAIVFPEGSFAGEVPGARLRAGDRILDLGAPRPDLIRSLAETAAEAQVSVRGFALMSADEVAALTGLTPAQARLALDREYDEPFLVVEETGLDRLVRAARARGLQVSHGGRFHHLMGGSDKGLAVRTLRALRERAGLHLPAVGLGDAATDLSLLQAVDRPIVMPRRDGSLDPVLAASLPSAEVAPAPGPEGWNAAVLAVLDGERLPAVAAQAARGESQTTS